LESNNDLGLLAYSSIDTVRIELDCCTEGSITITKGCEQTDDVDVFTEQDCTSVDVTGVLVLRTRQTFEFRAEADVPYFIDFGEVKKVNCPK
jgi:hypothetical protein